MMPENKEIPNRDVYVTFYLGNKKIFADLEKGGIPKEPNDSLFFTDKQVKSIKDFFGRKKPNIDDAVRSPKHYKLPGLNIESIDVLRSVLTPEEFKGFCRGNALKYLIRAGKKDNELQDIKKSRHIYWMVY
jgi:hypothetical protein|nr:MAG TPA_asm: nucelotide kinase [Caudoviricetes sp.]